MKKSLVGYSIVSPLQLFNYLIYWNEHSNEYDNFIIFIDYYWGYNIIPDKYIVFCKENNINIHINMNINLKNKYLNNLDKYTVLFVGTPSIRLLLMNSNYDNVIIVDEGLSTYAGFKNLKKANERETGKKLSYGNFLLKKFLIEIILAFKFKKKEDFLAFNIQTGFINEKYKNGFLKLCNKIKKNNFTGKHCGRKVIVFCSQPFVELKIKKEIEYVEYLRNLKDFVNNKGFDFLVKKHPVEKIIDYSKYDLDTLEYNGIIEEYFYANNVEGIISAISTSSMLVPAIFGVKSYIVDYSPIDDLDICARKIFSNYTKSISDFVD